ncbi:MAG: hypothetical protein LH468_11375 [Nocardioides sp.]|nr:hypothetical protein [Nocardioides sp.]
MTDLLQVADELYAGPLADFTPTRDARARALKKDDPELSAAIRALRKPSLAAWVVNLLVRRETEQVDQVLQVGQALRGAQESMSGEELRALTRQRRQLTAAVTGRARSLAGEEGQRVTQAVADQVEATLTAAMLDAECGRAVRSGLLVTPLAATGVDQVDVAAALAAAQALGFEAPSRQAPELPRPGLRVVPDPEADEKALASARAALEQAETELEQATGSRDEAAGTLTELEARGMQIQARIDELRRSIADLENESDELDDELVDAEEAVAVATAVRAEAERVRDRARVAVERHEHH